MTQIQKVAVMLLPKAGVGVMVEDGAENRVEDRVEDKSQEGGGEGGGAG